MDGLLHGPWVYLALFGFAVAENSIGLGLVLPIDTLVIGAASLSALGELSAPEIVLVVAAWLLIKFVFGFITSILASLGTALIFGVLVVAIIWAIRRL